MRSKKKLIAAASSVCFAAMMSLTAYASGDVAGAVTSTWTTARSQVVSVVNNAVCEDNTRIPRLPQTRSA